MFLSLYTDKAKGILTEQRFMTVSYTHLAAGGAGAEAGRTDAQNRGRGDAVR